MRRSHDVRPLRRPLRLLLAASLVALLATAATPGPVPLSFVYIHSNTTPNELFGFRVGPDGKLSPLSNSPFQTNNTTSNCGGACQTAVYSTKKKLLFASGGHGISGLRVGTDGALSLVAGSPFGAAALIGVTEVDNGAATFVYGAESAANQVRGYALQADGGLTEVPGSPFPAGMQLDGMTGARKYVFATSDATPAVAAFKVQANGALVAAPGSPFSVATDGGDLQNVFVDPTGKTVYVPDFRGGPIRIFGFKIRGTDAALTSVAGSPFALGLSSMSALALRGTSSLYAFGPPGGGGGDDVQFVRRKASSGVLTAGVTGKSGLTFPRAGAVDPSGRVVVLVGDTPTGLQAASLLVGRKGKLSAAGMTPLTGVNPNRVNAVVFAKR